MKIASIADVKARLSAYLRDAEATDPVVITRNGKAAAVLVAPEDEDDLEGLVLSRSARFRSILDRSRSSIKSGKGMADRLFWTAVKK